MELSQGLKDIMGIGELKSEPTIVKDEDPTKTSPSKGWLSPAFREMFGLDEEAPAPAAPAKAAHVMDALIPKLFQVESSGEHLDERGKLTKSPKGALGIAQIMPKAGADPGYGIPKLVDNTVEQQTIYATNYLRKMYDIFGTKEHALAAYNAGPGAIHRATAKGRRHNKDWKTFLPEETRNYIKRNLDDPTPETK